MSEQDEGSAALEARIRRLEDVEAIRELKARYGELADQRYPRGRVAAAEELERLAQEIAALFTEDAEWDGGSRLGVCRGRDAIRARMAEPTLRFAWHYFVQPRIQIHGDGDSARATWRLLAPSTTLDGRPHWMAGAEEDEYRRVDGVWLHSRMRLRVTFFAPHADGWE